MAQSAGFAPASGFRHHLRSKRSQLSYAGDRKICGTACRTPTCDRPFRKRLLCKRAAHDVYIGRPSKWGNPFEIGRDGTREEVIARYHEWILEQPQLMAALPELRGKVLGCWCHPNACHGDVLARLAELPTEAEIDNMSEEQLNAYLLAHGCTEESLKADEAKCRELLRKLFK